MHDEFDLQALKAFYGRHLKDNLLGFWLARGIDREDGGYYTCFDNAGEHLVSQDKYTWSQGRMVWVFAKLASMTEDLFSAEERREFMELSASGARFLMNNCRLANGNCAFLMDKAGHPKEEYPGSGYDTGIQADGFVVLGLARYAWASGDRQALEYTADLYRSILRRLDHGDYRSNPYPVPKGYKFHGTYMSLLIQSMELDDAMAGFCIDPADPLRAELRNRMLSCMDEIMNHFVREDGVLHEMIGLDNQEVDSLLGRYVNIGHSIEDMWFVMHAAIKLDRTAYIAKACDVVETMFDIGWDRAHGGLFLFSDHAGGMPKGEVLGLEGTTMLKKVRNDWDSKLWWPHSETLYAALFCYRKTWNPAFLEMFWKVHHYAFKTFPNPDTSIGEWIQIRDRQGVPLQKVVALPVKDPFHIIRNVVMIIELLASWPKEAAP